MKENLDNLRVGDDIVVYRKDGLFEVVFYVQRMTANYLVIGGTKFNKNHGWMCRDKDVFVRFASEEDVERVEKENSGRRKKIRENYIKFIRQWRNKVDAKVKLL